MKSKYANIVIILVIMVVCTLSMGHAAFGSDILISSIVADVRISSDVRVTGVSLKSSNSGGINYVDYDVDSVVGNVNLNNANSIVTLQVSITNFGNEEMGIWDITGLPDNLYKTISGYEMKTKLCDQSGSCSLGSITTFDITLAYDTYDAVKKNHEFRLDFEFRKMHKVTYTGITNIGYPTSVIDGGTLTFTATSNVPPKIVVFDSNNDRVNYNDYSYVYGTFTYNNVLNDINLKYQDKAYIAVMSDNTYYKESAYKTIIDSVQFVDYVDTSNAIKTYDLSEISGSKDVIGWITSGNDLYIGSEWNIYSKNLDCTFYGMTGIKSIVFGNLNTSECTNMHYMFRNCSGLISLDLSSFDTSNVTNMGRLFEGCASLLSLDVSSFNTGKVTNMRALFSGCSSLTSLDVSSFNTSNVTAMEEMFKKMNSLLAIDVSGFNTSKAINMSQMFYLCSQLTTLDLSGFNTQKVTDMSNMFNGSGLENLDLSSFNTSRVTNMASMFSDMLSLLSLDLSGFDTSNVTNMSSMFCNVGIQSLNISGFNTSKVTNMSHMFRRFAGTSLDLSSFDTSNVTNMFNMFRRFSGTSLDLSSFNTSKVTDMSGMFSLTTNIKEIKVSNLWVVGESTNIDNMFDGSGVSNVTFV